MTARRYSVRDSEIGLADLIALVRALEPVDADSLIALARHLGMSPVGVTTEPRPTAPATVPQATKLATPDSSTVAGSATPSPSDDTHPALAVVPSSEQVTKPPADRLP